MKNVVIIISVLFMTGIFFSCSEENSTVNAEKITQNQFITIPGYEWFSNAKANYNPMENVVNDIKSNYNLSQHKFVIFVKPSCSCNDKYYQTPNFLKTLQNADISDDNIEIWTLSKVTNIHPYKDIVTLKDLPAIFIFKNGVPVYSVSDSLNTINTNVSGSEFRIEQAVLLGLEK